MKVGPGTIDGRGRAAGVDPAGGSGPSDVYAVGNTQDQPRHAILHFDGDDWQIVHAGDGSGLGGVAGRSASDVCAVGWWVEEDAASHTRSYSSLVLHFNGTSWTEIPSGLEAGLGDVWPRGSEEYVAIGAYDTLVAISFWWVGSVAFFVAQGWPGGRGPAGPRGLRPRTCARARPANG